MKESPKEYFKKDNTLYEAPFQIIGAESAIKNKSGVDLNNLEKLYTNDEIKVYPNGHLIIAHYS